MNVEKTPVVIFVCETTDLAKTDNVYLSALSDIFYHDFFQGSKAYSIPAKRIFVHASGKGNFQVKAKAAVDAAKRKIPSFTNPVFYVVVCFDIDSTGKEEKKINEALAQWCQENGYIPLVFSKNIEAVLNVPHSEADKVERAKIFARTKKGYIKEDAIKSRLSFSLDDCFVAYERSNYFPVMSLIIDQFSTLE